MTPWTVVLQAPLSTRFSRQEYWSGFPCPPSGDLPNPGIEPASPVDPAGGFFTTEPPRKPQNGPHQKKENSKLTASSGRADIIKNKVD